MGNKGAEEKRLHFAVEDPDAPGNWPRVWLIWRGNALLSSAKGHEYFLKHYLGTHHNSIADESDDMPEGVKRSDPAPVGKLDLVVDINFRMDTSALYSDLILPAATWYEKDDLNSTDLHSFIHPLSAAVPPCWESRSDWDIFKALAAKTAELARTHFPAPFREVMAAPLVMTPRLRLPKVRCVHGTMESVQRSPAGLCHGSRWWSVIIRRSMNGSYPSAPGCGRGCERRELAGRSPTSTPNS